MSFSQNHDLKVKHEVVLHLKNSQLSQLFPFLLYIIMN